MNLLGLPSRGRQGGIPPEASAPGLFWLARAPGLSAHGPSPSSSRSGSICLSTLVLARLPPSLTSGDSDYTGPPGIMQDNLSTSRPSV